MKHGSVRSRGFYLWLVGMLIFSACSAPLSIATPVAGADTATGMAASEASPSDTVSVAIVPSNSPSRVASTGAEAATPTALKIIVVQQGDPSAQVSVRTEPTATSLITPTTTVGVPPAQVTSPPPQDVEPSLLTDRITNQKCGSAKIIAFDGHSLRATPRLPLDNNNFYERVPEGTQVELIDCVFWTNRELQTWVGVRTPVGKLGWMLVQPDALLITIFPSVQSPPRLTSIPPGTTVAYVPPSAQGSHAVDGSATASSIALDFVPVIGDVKGVAEAVTGYDLVTGESLGNWRWFGLLGLVGLAEVGVLSQSGKVARGIGLADDVEAAARGAEDAARVARDAEKASEALRSAGKVDEVARSAEEAARVAREAGKEAEALREAGKLDEAARAAERASQAARDAEKAREVTEEVLREAGKFDNAAREASVVLGEQRILAENAAEVVAKFEQPCSFAAETPVATLAGHVPISQIRAGDTVLAYREDVAATGYYTVTATFSHLDGQVVRLTIAGHEVITTPDHPFYVSGQWVPARRLEVGDRLLEAGGKLARVEQIERESQPRVMYNLTVAEAHTYFVGSGEWLVHNACSHILRRNIADSTTAQWDRQGVDWQAHHLIPGEYEDWPAVREAKKAGWDIDGADNGIALPASDEASAALGLPSHRGYHSQYSGRVGRELEALQDEADAAADAGNVWSAQMYASRLRDLTQKLRSTLVGASHLD